MYYHIPVKIKLIAMCYVLLLRTRREGKGKVVRVLNYLSTMPWRRTGERNYSSTIFDFDTIWKWVVSFKPRPLYSRGNRPWYPLLRGCVNPRTGLDIIGKNKSCPFRKSNSGRPARSPSLSRLLNTRRTQIIMSARFSDQNFKWGSSTFYEN
jgi:hypothetical protein